MLKKIYLLAIGFFLLSCHDDAINLKKEDNNSQAQSMFYKIYNSEAKNHLLIENLNGIYDKNNISNITSISSDGSPLKLTINGKTLVAPISLTGKGGSWRTSSYDVKSLFGKKIFLKTVGNNLEASIFNNNSSIASRTTEDGLSVYIPEILSASVTELDSNGNITPGTVIRWNKDVNNVNGISMMVEYNPYEQFSTSVLEEMPSPESRFIEMQDTGFYVITEEDLNNFPSGSNLSFYLGRTAYAISTDGNVIKDTSIGAITAVRADFEVAY